MICLAKGYLSVPLDIKIPHQFRAEKRVNSKGYLKRQSFGLKPLTLRARREEMATVMITPREKDAIMLTSGASGRINALLSLRLWKSLFMVVNAFVLLLFLPFRRRKVASTASVTAAGSQGGVGGCGCGAGGSGMGKEERSVEKKGVAVVRVPSAMVPARKSAMASAVVDKEVAARRVLAIKRVLEDDGKDSIREFMLLDAPRGVSLFTQSWTPAAIKVRALVVVLHGLNEHSGRYNNFAKQLNANGYKVYGMDWIGHGGSDGLHAYVHSLDDAVSDLKLFIRKVVTENPGLPCFCFGHSTGGAIILKAALDSEVKTRIAGLVLTSPAVGVQPSHPIFAVLAPVVAFLLPRYQFSAANKRGAVVCRDPEALLAKYSDPLVFTGSIRVRTGYEILRITSYLQQNLKRLTVPFLVLHGTADAVTDPGASQKLHNEAASADKAIRLLEGLLHDLLFEPERQQIVDEIIEWLNQRS